MQRDECAVRQISGAEYNQLTAYQQGYVQYEQGAWEGSELKHLTNPYVPGSLPYTRWDAGQANAKANAQESNY